MCSSDLAPIIKGPEVVVSDSELRGLTAFSYPFDCQNLAMTNSVLRGVIAQSLSRTPLEVLTWTTVRSASSAFERGIDARTVKIDQCSLALNTAATIRTSELTVENSVIMATKIALAAETARITGSILVASQGSVSVGTDRESDGLLVSGRSIALAGCLVSFEMPIEHLWKSFVAGELEAPVVPEKAVGLLLEKNLLVWSGKAGAIETEAPPGAPVDARSNTVLCESADQLPDGFSHVERVGNSVPGTITTRCPGNETLARVIRDLFPERGD